MNSQGNTLWIHMFLLQNRDLDSKIHLKTSFLRCFGTGDNRKNWCLLKCWTTDSYVSRPTVFYTGVSETTKRSNLSAFCISEESNSSFYRQIQQSCLSIHLLANAPCYCPQKNTNNWTIISICSAIFSGDTWMPPLRSPTLNFILRTHLTGSWLWDQE